VETKRFKVHALKGAINIYLQMLMDAASTFTHLEKRIKMEEKKTERRH